MQGKKFAFFGFQINRFNMFIVFSIALFLCLLTVLQAAPSPKPAEDGKRHCQLKEPCGWAIYNAFTEIVDGFTNNINCVCPPGKNCLRTEDYKLYQYITYRCMEEAFYI